MSFYCRLAFILGFAFLLGCDNGASLKNAQTFDDVVKYVDQKMEKYNNLDSRSLKDCLAIAKILMPASDKLLEVAQTADEKCYAYQMKIEAFQHLTFTDAKGAEERFETFLEELALNEDARVRGMALYERFCQFERKVRQIQETPENLEKIKTELKTWLDQEDCPVALIAYLGLVTK